ncbi:MAG TPA: ribosome small subunit-dependent GTPase A [Vicinamibacterales bacterium]
MTLDLRRIGWDDRLAEAFAPHAAAGLVPARIALEHTHIYRVLTDGDELLARVAGRLRHRAGARSDFPAVGDWVAIEPATRESGDARIVALLPRRSRFSRRAAGDPTEEQIVAANIDTVFLVGGLDGDFNPRRIERYLLVATESGASPVIVLNKADLVDDPHAFAAEVSASAPGIPVHVVSCREPETLAPLGAHLGSGKTGALLGSSGVGKSTIVNRLVGYDLLATREVRLDDSRGRHTSTARQLVLLPDDGGVLIDTPGMRELQLWDVGEGMLGAFTDIDELAAGCRFRDCRHRQEPGCAVRQAVASGAMSVGRLESYLKLQDEQAYQARQIDQRAQLDEKRRMKQRSKAITKHLKDKERS